MVLPMNSMDYKLKELLNEVRLDDSALQTLDKAVTAVIEAIKSIPDQPVTSNFANGFKRDLRVPADKVSFNFNSPEQVQLAGSFAIRCLAKPRVHVDVIVRMPKVCFREKDYLNHLYHAKRCLYLCTIEKELKSCAGVRKVEWSTFENEARKPVLLVYPVIEHVELSQCFIRIIPSATSLFNAAKLDLSRNNVRAFSKGGESQATPKYNSSILEDMFLEEHTKFVCEAFHEWKSLGDALILLKIWARNRTSIHSHDCFNGYLISVLVSFLSTKLGGNVLDKFMTPMQIFSKTLTIIMTSKLSSEGFFISKLKKDGTPIQQPFAIPCDLSHHFKLTFRMTKEAFTELQDEASRTLICMAKCKDDSFEQIFMTRVDFPSKFDYCLRINLKGNSKVSAYDFCLDDESWTICEKEVHSLLQQGLMDRAQFIRVLWRSVSSSWNVEDGFSKFGNEPMLVGVLVSSQEKSFRVVDIGPEPENKEEASKFRKFWGDKAELRRFRDGKIAESTVWECDPWERHLIIKRITEHVLSRHFLIKKEDMIHLVDQLDFSLKIGSKDPISYSGSLLQAFELLSKRLRLLDETPLKVSSVQPLHPALRHTAVFPPQPHLLAYEKVLHKKLPKIATTCIELVEVMIQLEGSGNWPLDSIAVEKTKIAFLLKIGESLQERWGVHCIASENEVNVLMSGYSFSLKILHDRGLTGLKGQDFQTADKMLFTQSQHSSMINGLHGRYPLYEPVVRLAKRWVSSHLFSSFLKDEAIELVVAYLFLRPFPFHAPNSRITGFLRFLRFFANFDWAFSPLIVDINEELSSQDEKEITENFILSRKAYENDARATMPAIFLATSYDKTSEAWTKHSPSRLVLKRVASYAQSSSDLLTNLILQGAHGPYEWESLFRTPLNNYDAIVLLHRDKISNPHHLMFPAEISHGKLVIRGRASMDFHPYIQLEGGLQGLEDARKRLMVDFDPARCFREDLNKEFPNTFNVWYDSLGSDAIGLTWAPKELKKRGRDSTDEIKQEPNDKLKEVGETGKGLVKGVYLLKAPRLS